jgi:nucleotidyltransferase substrate binding protein (TIGR01987 family)
LEKFTPNYAPLEKAIASLEEALNFFFKQEEDTVAYRVARAGAIQNFEFTYELCWKFLHRKLEQDLGKLTVAGISRKELYRIAVKHLLLENSTSWFEFHEARNLTSHTYNGETADEVCLSLQSFLNSAKKLYLKLNEV